MKLQNIYNYFSNLRVSIREDDGSLKIKDIKGFSPYFYEPDKNGEFIAYDGTKLSKVHCESPHEIRNRKSPHSYEADVYYTKRYLIDEVKQIEKSKTRYILFDIESPIENKKYLDPRRAKEAPYPVTFIVCYDNYEEKYTEFDYRDYKSEYDMLEAFCQYIKERSPDMLLAWNILDFDYPYLFYRIPDFPKKISPISQEDWREQGDIRYPALVSVLDLMAMDHKFTLGKRDSYAQDNVVQEEFEDEEAWGETDFVNDEDRVKEKCLNDVQRMVKLMAKNDYIEYFDQIRLDTGCLWEDLPSKKVGFKWQSNNSKPIDVMFLREAKNLGIVLPNKPHDSDEDSEYIGAYREIFKKGIFKNCIGKYDLGSAYPTAIMDFCLDPANVNENEEGVAIDLYHIMKKEDGTEDKINIATHHFKQDENAILPTVVKKLLTTKNQLKEELNSCDPESPQYKVLDKKYSSTKARINSLYGVLGNPYFRLHDHRVAETDTFLIRDLLLYVRDELAKLNYEVVYIDTDSVFINSNEDLSQLLNKLVLSWGMDKYGKRVNIKFDYEGQFERLFLVALCRYIGYLKTPSGKVKEEIKGLQMIRRNSPEFTKTFQRDILDFIMDANPKDKVFERINQWINKIELEPLVNLGTPCKLSKPRKEYKKQEKFFRAMDATVILEPEFNKEVEEKFWYVAVNKDENPDDVLAFDKKYQDHVKHIDYKSITETHILNTLVPIFHGLEWGKDLLDFAETHKIIMESKHRNTLLEMYDNFQELKQYYSARVAKKRLKALTEV